MTRPTPSPKTWVRAVRLYALPASIVPVLVGAGLAFHQGQFHLGLFAVTLVASMALQAGTSMISDYYDFHAGVDPANPFAAQRVLVRGLLTPHQVRAGALAWFGLATALGLYLFAVRGWIIIALGLAGLAGGFFYTALPVGYKYRALGDPLVFVLMGPLMVLGAHFVQTGRLELLPLALSLPVGCLVTAILHANNIRDRQYDILVGPTIAYLIGFSSAKLEYVLLVAGAYASLLATVLLAGLPWLALLPLATLPVGTRLVLWLARAPDVETVALLDQRTARLHALFGALLGLSLFASGWL